MLLPRQVRRHLKAILQRLTEQVKPLIETGHVVRAELGVREFFATDRGLYIIDMEEGGPAGSLEPPRHPYRQALWAARPRLGPGRDQPLHPLKGNVPSLKQLGAGCPFAPRCPLATARCAAEPPPFHRQLACWEVSP